MFLDRGSAVDLIFILHMLLTVSFKTQIMFEASQPGKDSNKIT